MSNIKKIIDKRNYNGEKALAVFITGGYPEKNNFSKTVLKTFDAGADIIEIGIPFSDPLADGPTIQKISQLALQNNVNLDYLFEEIYKIRNSTGKPLILMGYANTLLQYGLNKFYQNCTSLKVDGIIVPDIPVEEKDFLSETGNNLDKIFLVSPNSPDKRILEIDQTSSGFLYCVSTLGTTGNKLFHSEENVNRLKHIYSLVNKNKTMIGFGISTPEDISVLKNCADGFITGSAFLKTIEKSGVNEALELIKSLRIACK